ncbi:DUF6266 family protein [Pedobacter nyackensis]|uniref:Uncharacterized protein n=1 Tax=Pedobacter nyackensis TaxID=475255 RepID=A0A1W2DB97_9SPHI|nr:DUF6266 family protein [Pedobacter nyackensis]SMC94534.1 hypothetical protein SAMN04488101_10695 [Pedobacter nyackensis]
MGVIKNGILGGFKGKTGTVVGYKLKDQDIIRGVGDGRKAPFTNGELKNQSKFGVSQRWLQPLTEFLRVGYKDYNTRYEGFVAAKSYISKNAIKQDDAGFHVDPELALLSYGDMDLAEKATAVSESPNTVTFKWSGGKSEYDDRAMFVLYDIDGQDAEFDTAAVKRELKTGVFNTSESFSGRSVHAYIAFVSEDRKRRSNSQYLGVITVL